MTLRPCYRATCDATDCTSAVMLPHDRTRHCRRQLEALGWAVVAHRVRSNAPGAPRLSYFCPAHRTWRPEGWREARAAVIRQRVAHAPRSVSLEGVKAPTQHLDAARRAAMAWMLSEVVGSQRAVARAFGVTPQRLNQLVDAYEVVLARRQRSAAGWIEPWAQRLRAAGAVP